MSGTTRGSSWRSAWRRPPARPTSGAIERGIYDRRFLQERPLLRALSPEGGPAVLLIDELDRADEPFEAFLLELLADFQITVPELGTIRAEIPPLVIITSNRTREVHDAIRRRCLYHWVDYPDAVRERAILRLRAPDLPERLSAEVVRFVQRVRGGDYFKLPGVAETIDWAQALAALDARELEPGAGGRDARRAAEVPGRHRQAARRRSGAAHRRSQAGGGRGVSDLATAASLAGLGGAGGGALAANLEAFGRLLRRAGLPVGPNETLAAMEALTLVPLDDRRQVHAALRAVMVRRRAHFEIFDQAFLLYWRNPEAARNAAAMALLDGAKKEKAKPPPGSRRLSEAQTPRQPPPGREQEPEERPPVDVALAVSERERLQGMDFEAMSAEEIARAKDEIRRLSLPLDARPTRRFRSDPQGPAIDLRATIRASLRQGRRGAQPRTPAACGPPAAAGGALRHLRQHGALCADTAAFPARRDERPRPRAFLPVRHAADERDAAVAPPRPGGGLRAGVARRPRLVRRHAHRRVARRCSTANGAAACSARARWCC